MTSGYLWCELIFISQRYLTMPTDPRHRIGIDFSRKKTSTLSDHKLPNRVFRRKKKCCKKDEPRNNFRDFCHAGSNTEGKCTTAGWSRTRPPQVRWSGWYRRVSRPRLFSTGIDNLDWVQNALGEVRGVRACESFSPSTPWGGGQLRGDAKKIGA